MLSRNSAIGEFAEDSARDLLIDMSQLELNNVTKAFGGLRAVDDVSFSVDEGSLTAVIGPNGAGKTTLFNVISGLMPPTRGAIRFMGRELSGAGHVSARAGIGRTFQNVRLFHDMTLLENVLCAWVW